MGLRVPVVTLVALVTATVRVTAVRIVQPYTVSVVAYNGTSGQGPQALNAEPRTDYCTQRVTAQELCSCVEVGYR